MQNENNTPKSEEPISEPTIKPEKTSANYFREPGLHAGTAKRLFRHWYDVEIVRESRHRTEDGRWWDIFFTPLCEEEFQRRHRKYIVDVFVDDEGNPSGTKIILRNYHIRDARNPPAVEELQKSEVTDPIKNEERRLRHNEHMRLYARKAYEVNKRNPEWMEKQRAARRDQYREVHGLHENSSEVVRRNANRRKYSDAINAMDNEARIAELLLKDTDGVMTPEEEIELEALLNGEEPINEGDENQENITKGL